MLAKMDTMAMMMIIVGLRGVVCNFRNPDSFNSGGNILVSGLWYHKKYSGGNDSGHVQFFWFIKGLVRYTTGGDWVQYNFS